MLSQRLPARSAALSRQILQPSCTRSLHATRPRRESQDVASDPKVVKPAGPTGETVALDFEHHPAPSGSEPAAGGAKAVVVAHGLFGSKQNWRSLSRLMAQRWAVPVYAVDLRNHGTSPHVQSMNYADMASDLLRFVKDHSLEKIALIGHSMGGKAVQSFALSPQLPSGVLDSLVSVDMSPATGKLSPEFESYVRAMLEINKRQFDTRKEAEELLAETEPDLGIRQFLLTNLRKAEAGSPWLFRIPVETISEHLSQIGDFPYKPTERTWDGRTLFVKGAKSKYINRRNIPICDQYFPNAQHSTIDAGHWVQAEKPREFVDVVGQFLRGK
ncbi:unnamed protein product [Parajaminaea phylloscopi]